MLNIDKKDWHKIDKNLEEAVVNGVRFVQPVNCKTIDISCNHCSNLIATIEDVESMKKSNVCESCHILYYYKT